MVNAETLPPADLAPAGVAPTDTRSSFVRALKTLLSLDEIQKGVRATPHGIFVSQPLVTRVSEAYAHHVGSTTGRGSDLPLEKASKRLFASSTPPLFYLVEPKRAHVGHLIELPLQNPQSTGLPTYLGTLDDARQTLHPRDPALVELPGVEVAYGRSGIEIACKAGARVFRMSETILREFSVLARESRTVRREAGGRAPALRDLIPILPRLLEKAHPPKESQRLLLPAKWMKRRDGEFLIVGSLVFVVDRRGAIQLCYERESRGLYFFIKRELGALAANRATATQGLMHLLRSRGRYFATINVNRVRYSCSYSMLIEFIKGVQHSAPEGARDWKRFSVVECLHELSNVLTRAQPIPRSKILRLVEKRRDRNAMYVINQRWIFVVSTKKALIEACIDKSAG